ncbi:MAG: TetR/AcrR family transcriptional regulator [Henriciella sp.]
MRDFVSMTLEDFRKNRSQAKQAAILDAAMALFRQAGFAGASMEDIAKKAAVSTATLYRHFRSKTALFEAVATTSIEALETQISQINSTDPRTRLSALAHAYAGLLAQPNTIGLMRMLVSETGRDSDLATWFYNAIKSRLGDHFDRAVQDLDKAGLLAEATFEVAPGQLQGMIEHAILMRGLILGDEAGPAAPVEQLAEDALRTWSARWLNASGI